MECATARSMAKAEKVTVGSSSALIDGMRGKSPNAVPSVSRNDGLVNVIFVYALAVQTI